MLPGTKYTQDRPGKQVAEDRCDEREQFVCMSVALFAACVGLRRQFSSEWIEPLGIEPLRKTTFRGGCGREQGCFGLLAHGGVRVSPHAANPNRSIRDQSFNLDVRSPSHICFLVNKGPPNSSQGTIQLRLEPGSTSRIHLNYSTLVARGDDLCVC
jgi:hypothetical protein